MGSEQQGMAALTGAYAELDPPVAWLLHEILRERDPELHAQLCESSELDEEQVLRFEDAVYSEFAQSMGREREPTEYAKRVDNALGAFMQRLVIERRP